MNQLARQVRFLSTQPFVMAAIDIVAEHFGVAVDKIRGRRRHRSVSRARAVAAFVLRKATSLSWPEIAAVLGGFDHSSMIAAFKRVKAALAIDAVLKWDLMQIARRLVDWARGHYFPTVHPQLLLEPPTGIEPAASPIPTERSAT